MKKLKINQIFHDELTKQEQLKLKGGVMESACTHNCYCGGGTGYGTKLATGHVGGSTTKSASMQIM